MRRILTNWTFMTKIYGMSLIFASILPFVLGRNGETGVMFNIFEFIYLSNGLISIQLVFSH